MNKNQAELIPLSRSPRWPSPYFAAEHEEGAISTDEAPRILIVEDDYFVGLQNEDMLTKAGFLVVGIATSADYALTLAAREQPDLVLMDIRLAHYGDGIDTAIKLLQKYGLRSVFVTAHADPATRSRAVAARPLGWLVKPFTAGALVKAVREALAAKQEGGGI
jgi:DNA-binding NarL/FixJ family response regulator